VAKPGSIREVLTQAVERLAAAGVESPRVDAELLLAHALGRTRTYLVGHPHEPLSEAAADVFEELLRRREARVPVPYLLGSWEFMGMPLAVSPAVLIPRPETETLVEAVAERLPAAARVLDVGAGSGCISIGLAKLLPRAEITALEPSPAAVEVARANVRALGFEGRVRVREGTFPRDTAGLEALDAVVSNPPYIPSNAVDQLAPELRLYEPRLALDGGPDGLDLLRALASVSPALLRAGGLLAVEVMQGQSDAVLGLLEAQPRWRDAEVVFDLAGVARVVVAYCRE
jgi:release factor glutamine methyltransferase